MPTNFPTNPDSYTTKVDGVDTVMAAHINDLQDAMMAVQDFALDLSDKLNKVYFASANDAWNFKPAGTDLFIVDSMSLSNVIVPSGHNLLVEFDAIGFFRDIYGANIHLYNSTTLLETFVAPMRMNVASARAGFHYSYKITTGGTYNLSIRCAASGSTAVDMDFLNRSLKATVI